jgi:hypothetical protein
LDLSHSIIVSIHRPRRLLHGTVAGLMLLRMA